MKLAGKVSMALTNQARAPRWSAPRSESWPWAVVGVLTATVILVLAIGGGRATRSATTTRGSGVSIIDRREVAPFTTVELAGANTVVIHVGTPLSVAVLDYGRTIAEGVPDVVLSDANVLSAYLR